MKTDHYIDELIHKEKQTEHNPFLATRIMSRIENFSLYNTDSYE